MNKLLVLAILFLVTASGQSQSLNLDSCYALARQHYPLIQQRDLIAKSSAYSIENAAKGYLPQINLGGQASYQSDVTQIPSPGAPVLSKDQYKIYADINQPLYEGGVVKAQKKIQETNAQVEQQKLEVELYKLRERVQQVFFGILLLNEQLKQTDLLQSDIQLGLRRTQAAVDNGTAFRSNLDLLKAESLKVTQRVIEINANKQAYLDMLGMLIGAKLDANTRLETPATIAASTSINRPELLLFDYQRNGIAAQRKLLGAKNTPKVNAFFQGGFGRPAFNILSNDFEPYYIGGIRLNYPLAGFYSLKNERSLLDISRKTLDVQQEVFLFNTNYALRQQNAEITKFQALISTDEEIIALRNRVKTTAAAQLENGVITPNDYLREVNAEDAAKQAKILHDLQLLLALYTQRVTANG